MYKLRPLIEKLNAKFVQWGIFHEKLSIDEAMVKYFGHHSLKQFIRGKPVRFGYKDWMLCSSTGYCYRFDTYCVAKEKQKNQKFDNMPLGPKIVLDLLEVVTEPEDHIICLIIIFQVMGFSLYCVIKVIEQLELSEKIQPKKCPLPTKKQVVRKDRGYFMHKYDKQNLLLLVSWKVNNAVTMITNYDSIYPLSRVKRWSKQEKNKIYVPQPLLLSNYNMGMCDVIPILILVFSIF